jgi:hypothetical protein
MIGGEKRDSLLHKAGEEEHDDDRQQVGEDKQGRESAEARLARCGCRRAL